MGRLTELVLSAAIVTLASSFAAEATGHKSYHGNRVPVFNKTKSVQIAKRPDHVMLNPQPLPPKYKIRLPRGSRYLRAY